MLNTASCKKVQQRCFQKSYKTFYSKHYGAVVNHFTDTLAETAVKQTKRWDKIFIITTVNSPLIRHALVLTKSALTDPEASQLCKITL